MLEESVQHDLLRRYVLGTLTKAEQEQVEKSCFADPVHMQQLWDVFDDVAERFLQTELPDAEAQQFAARLHGSPFLRERVTQLQSLLTVIASETTPTAVAPTTAALSLKAALPIKVRWPRFRPLQWGLVAAGLVLLIAGVLWRNPAPSEQVARRAEPLVTPTLSPLPAPSSKTPSPPHFTGSPTRKPALPALATFLLMHKTVREAGGVTPLPIAPSVHTLVLQLEVPAAPHPRYQVTVQTSDGRTQTYAEMRPQRQAEHWFISVRVPVADLGTEPFLLQIRKLSPPESPVLIATRTLQVEKQ
jgi:hypothetical protein